MYKILIVEDDRIIADNVCEQLLNGDMMLK